MDTSVAVVAINSPNYVWGGCVDAEEDTYTSIAALCPLLDLGMRPSPRRRCLVPYLGECPIARRWGGLKDGSRILLDVMLVGTTISM